MASLSWLLWPWLPIIIANVHLLSMRASASSSPTTLHAASGEFGTPNYPSNYGDNQLVVSDILLQPHETIQLISGDESPQFEIPHDSFVVQVNGTTAIDLSAARKRIGEDWWVYSASSTPTRISLRFKSDGSEVRRGLRGRYSISCAMTTYSPGKPKNVSAYDCVHGQCQLGRTSQETKPPTCVCTRGFSGKRCDVQNVESSSVVIELNNATGEIATPNYPQPYNPEQNVTWRMELHEHEEIEFFRTTGEIPEFEPNCPSCDTFTLRVDGEPLVEFHKVSCGIGGTSLVKIEARSGELKLVEVVFRSDILVSGKGFRVHYRVTCDTACSFSTWCMNGGSCALQSDANAASSLQKVCICPKTFTGPKCEDKVNFTTETVSLKNAIGFIETPNFPAHYPLAKNITWSLSLQRFESIVINLVQTSGTPDFEACCDYVELTDDGDETKRLSEIFLSNLTHLEKIAGPKELLVKFVSDGGVTGRGMKLQYNIVCIDQDPSGEEPCLNGGSCTVARSEQSAAPVHCNCPKHYYGPRCEHRRVYITEIRPVFIPAGLAETPNFPSLYPSGSSIVWRWQLQEFERITFQVDRRTLSRPDFEHCCDDFRLLHGETVLSDFGKGQYRDTIVVQGSKNSSKDVTLQFMSDENNEGKGMRLKFAIDCHNNISEAVCLNGGTCLLNRSAHSAGPVTCLCPKGFTGSRCQEHVEMQSETYHLRDSSGYFKTPNYPSIYPPGQHITWQLALQPFEVLTVEKVDPLDPDFEECCDSLHLKVNGALRYDFKSAKGKPESAVLETISAEHEKLDITITFSSDGGNGGRGFRGRYSIICIEGRDIDAENACLNGGVCSVGRSPTSVHPVQCKCAKSFQGPRCKDPVEVSRELHQVTSSKGRIATPGFPGYYENSRTMVWTWNLKQYEFIKFRKVSQQASTLENCCDHLTLLAGSEPHDLGDLVRTHGTHQLTTIHASQAGSQVSLTFNSDGAINGPGVEIEYSIGCQIEACFDNGTCLVTNEETSDIKRCLDSNCPHPWVENANKDGCFLLSEKHAEENAHQGVCEEHQASLAEILTPQDNHIIGMEAMSPLVWIGLSDAQSEREWIWAKSGKSALFANWGPGYPSGLGDYAVMYPNRWTLGQCSDKKRFLCEAKEEYCPSEWIRLENNNGKCYYQSKYALEFESAASMCSLMAPGGQLAKWDGKTALSFGPEQWDTSSGEGPAHFWVGIGKCRTTDIPAGAESTSEVYSIPVDEKDTPSGIAMTGSDITNNKVPNLCGSKMQLESCAFVFPNAWADYSVTDRNPTHFPTVACQRRTTLEFRKISRADDSHTAITELPAVDTTTLKYRKISPTNEPANTTEGQPAMKTTRLEYPKASPTDESNTTKAPSMDTATTPVTISERTRNAVEDARVSLDEEGLLQIDNGSGSGP